MFIDNDNGTHYTAVLEMYSDVQLLCYASLMCLQCSRKFLICVLVAYHVQLIFFSFPLLVTLPSREETICFGYRWLVVFTLKYCWKHVGLPHNGISSLFRL
jgi:hypothetical protein